MTSFAFSNLPRFQPFIQFQFTPLFCQSAAIVSSKKFQTSPSSMLCSRGRKTQAGPPAGPSSPRSRFCWHPVSSGRRQADPPRVLRARSRVALFASWPRALRLVEAAAGHCYSVRVEWAAGHYPAAIFFINLNSWVCLGRSEGRGAGKLGLRVCASSARPGLPGP